jgi:ATP-dependent 26S proteasome regulatory subunit
MSQPPPSFDPIANTPSDAQRLAELLDARHACVAIITFEEGYAIQVLNEVAVDRGINVRVWSVTRGLRDGLIEGAPPVPDTDHPAAALVTLTRDRHISQGVVVMLDLCGHLRDERTLRAFREAVEARSAAGDTIVLIDQNPELPQAVKSIAARFELSYPDEKELEALIRATLRKLNEQRRITVELTRANLSTMLRNLRGLTRRQAMQVITSCVCDDRRLDAGDMNRMLAHKRQALGSDGLLEYVETPVSLDEVGGLTKLKQWLKRRTDALSDEATKFGLDAPRGVLMLGVQGAGKSLAAKAVATAWQRPLLRMDVGALYDRYIGESERRLRDALRQAEQMSPIVLWIDEIEKGFASAASQSSDGGLSKRMFGALLTWMQERREPVFLIATANDIEALPPELLRKGRFDEIFFVDLPLPDARRAIFTIHLQKRKRDPKSFDLDALVAASDAYSGAEIEQAVLSALHDAFAAKSELTTEHVLKSLRESPPLSVTMREKIEELREWSRGRCVPAD